MNDIHGTLGGSLPPNIPPYPVFLQSLRFDHQLKHRIRPNNPTTMSSTSTHPAPSNLRTQLHDTRSLLTDHNERVGGLEGVISEHDAIRREVRLLRQLGEKMSGDRGSELVGVGAASDNDDHAISIRTIAPYELESVEEEDGDQMARQEQRQQQDEEEDEERRSRRAELARQESRR